MVALLRVHALMSNGCCSICLSAMELKTGAVHMNGSVSLSYKCSRYEEGFEDKLPRVKGLDGTLSRFTPTNVCAVETTIMNGSGHAGCVAMFNGLNLPMFHDMSYYRHAKFLYGNMKMFLEESRTRVIKSLEIAYEKTLEPGKLLQQPSEHHQELFLDIAVSFDGTWMRRGFLSHIGACFVIDCETETVVDFVNLCNLCRFCEMQKKSSPEAFALWKAKHASTCEKNFDGNSGGMETKGAVHLWSRSEGYGLRYTNFLGDGDSSAFNAISRLHGGEGPYSVPVVKEECLNHVSKCLGTHLRKLKGGLKVDDTMKASKPIRRSLLAGKDGLTDKEIDKLQSYYAINIRSHETLNHETGNYGIVVSCMQL